MTGLVNGFRKYWCPRPAATGLGDDSYTVQIDVENDFATLSLVYSVARKGNTVIFGTVAALEAPPDAALLEETMRTMAEGA